MIQSTPAIRRAFTLICLTCLLLVVKTGPLLAQEQPARTDDASLEQLKADVAQAYANIDTYQSTVNFQHTQQQGRWTLTQSGDFYVAVDRSGKRYLVDAPGWTIADDGTNLLLTAPGLPDGYLALPSAGMVYADAAQALPFISQPMVPDLALLLSDTPQDPLEVFKSNQASTMQYLPADEGHTHPGVAIDAGASRTELRFDPKTYLLTQATTTQNGPQGTAPMRVTFTMNHVKRNQPVDEKALTLDVTGREKFTSLQDLAQSGQGAAGGNDENALVGQKAPEFTLVNMQGDKVTPSDIDNEIVILDFWATWCGPCVAAMPKLQAVADWAKKENLPVSIYAVNLRETAKQIEGFMEKHDLSLTVLLDREGQTADQFGVQGIPHTVIIHKGVVAAVHVGFDPQMDTKFKEELQKLLAE